MAGFDEWDQWEADAKCKHPIRYFLSWSGPIAWGRFWNTWVHEPWYWLKCRLWHRYNVVVCRSLPPTWVDRSDLLLHAAFQCLVDFIEKEENTPSPPHVGGANHFTGTLEDFRDWYATGCGVEDTTLADKRYADWQTVKECYHWWKESAKTDYADNDHEKENEMLAKLISVRGYLWT